MPFAKIGTKVSVSTLLRDSQRPVDAPLPTRGTSPLLLEETEAKTANVVFVMRSIKARIAHHDVMSMDNSMQKGTTTAKRFKNE